MRAVQSLHPSNSRSICVNVLDGEAGCGGATDAGDSLLPVHTC